MALTVAGGNWWTGVVVVKGGSVELLSFFSACAGSFLALFSCGTMADSLPPRKRRRGWKPMPRFPIALPLQTAMYRPFESSDLPLRPMGVGLPSTIGYCTSDYTSFSCPTSAHSAHSSESVANDQASVATVVYEDQCGPSSCDGGGDGATASLTGGDGDAD